MTAFSVDTSEHREIILAIQRAALAAVDPGAAVRRHVERRGSRLIVGGRAYDLDTLDHVWVIGGGKAAVAMASTLHDIVGDRLTGGLVVTKHGYGASKVDTGPVEVVEAGHPVPDQQGVDATRRLVDLAARAGPRDLLLAVISGGGSALMVLPAPGLGLDDVQHTTDLLLRAGATIVEVNTVRKHLSQIKGGGLVRLSGRAQIAGLVLSDVVGDPLDTIASGPLSPDLTTFADAWAVIEGYDLADRLPPPVRARLEAGRAGDATDTPKPGSALFGRVQVIVVGSNRLAATAAVKAARAWGLNSLLLSTFVEGEARHVARVAAALAKEVAHSDHPVPRPACLVWGGETTVTVRGSGKGGRNQELALAATLALDGVPGVLLVALATDGTDGPTDAAGAVATGDTAARARSLGLDPAAHLAENNAYPFFDALDDLIRTGPTGTNVNDLLFLFVFPELTSDERE
ncbi:MAG: glycerate kinase [Anaerolineae bacterium]|nr:glycerate kinase [Anaerolineae bacterium]